MALMVPNATWFAVILSLVDAGPNFVLLPGASGVPFSGLVAPP